MQRAAYLISIAAHPVFMAYFGLLMVLNLHFVTASKIQGGSYWAIHVIFLAALVVLPLLGLIITFRKFKAKDWEGLGAKERRELGLVMAIMYGMVTWSLSTLFVHHIIQEYLICLTIGTAIVSLLQRFKRISFHAYAAAGLIPLIVYISISTSTDLIQWFALVVIVAGVVCSARLLRKAHDLNQIHWGLALGIGINTLIFTYFHVVQQY
jgi:hypothetical protein